MSLAVAIVAFANPNVLEERQALPCLDALCALRTPLTLSGDLSFATSIVFGGFTIRATATQPVTATVGGACCTGATCMRPTGTTTVPTTVPVTATLPATLTVPIPPLHDTTLTVTLPFAKFSGGVTLYSECWRERDSTICFVVQY